MSHRATPCHRWSPTSSTMEPTTSTTPSPSAWKSLNLNRRLEAAGFAKRSGIEADDMVADAWFGTKTMLRAAYELGGVRCCG